MINWKLNTFLDEFNDIIKKKSIKNIISIGDANYEYYAFVDDDDYWMPDKLEKQLTEKTNPPKFKVEFFENQKNLDKINCYSNEANTWAKSNTTITNNILKIEFRAPFEPRRGRINCSLNDNGKWRWFGIQFPIKKN